MKNQTYRNGFLIAKISGLTLFLSETNPILEGCSTNVPQHFIQETNVLVEVVGFVLGSHPSDCAGSLLFEQEANVSDFKFGLG